MNASIFIKALVIFGSLFVTTTYGQEVFVDSMFAVQRIEEIVYGTAPINNPHGDFELLLDLYQPTGPEAPGLRPGFVIIHGGSFDHGSRNEPKWVEHATKMAARGYTAVSIDYRLIGQVPIISEEFIPVYQAIVDSNSYRPLGAAAALEDATRAYRWLVDNATTYHVDTNRIAVGGHSAGAITSLGIAYTVDDFEVTMNPPIGSIMDVSGGLDSFVTLMETGESPLIIVHGTNDTTVPFWMAQDLVDQAQAVGISYEFCPIAGAGHDIDIFTVEFEGETLFDRSVQFFYYQLDLINIIPTGVTDPLQLSTSRQLYTNRPNPFNPQTTISFSVDYAQHVTISVFDLTGRRVVGLADQMFGAGTHTTEWLGKDVSGQSVSSGTYIVRMESEGFVESQKIMLVR